MRYRTVTFNPYSCKYVALHWLYCSKVQWRCDQVQGEGGKQIEPFTVIRTGNEERPVSRGSVGAADWPYHVLL